MTLANLKKIFLQNACSTIYVKRLAPNDNSKNQVYLSGSFDILNIFPVTTITADSSGDWKRERFKATLDFYWIQEESAALVHAPKAQLILYPKYPEVRFSGFLSACSNPPSYLMKNRIENRLLFLSNTKDGKVLGFVASPTSNIAVAFSKEIRTETHGVFDLIHLSPQGKNRLELLNKLKQIHKQGWITSKRLNNKGLIMPCNASNCGGYTLEAELGITPNGFSEPDYLGWEIKQFGVSNFDHIYSKIITLMTPEPTGGDYKDLGIEAFLRKYGYDDKKGRKDRINFGGVHKVNLQHPTTKLNLQLIGYDKESNKIRQSNGQIALVTSDDRIAASWSFTALLKHWNRKHRQACYIPSLSESNPNRRYRFGNKVILGIGTDFVLFLNELQKNNIIYDPAIKMENASTSKPKIKRRSQFRIKSKYLGNLYQHNEEVQL